MVKTSRTLLLTSAAVVALSVTPHTAMAGPEGGIVVGGSANISQSGTKTDIHQHSNKAILDWRSFDIGAQEHVEFHQPSSSAMALNRIRDTKASQIDGKLTANGHIMLINPNGVVFGSSSQVDVGSLTATTADIDNDDFMAGKLTFNKAGKLDAAIINHGSITVKEAGLVNLVAPRVENHGVIAAKLGKVQLAAADTFTLDMAGDGLLQVAVTEEQAAKLTRNTGLITAEGGTIALTAFHARTIVDSLVENAGIIEASSMTKQGGKVILGGAHTKVSGVINADGQTGGGEILIGGDYQGRTIENFENAQVTEIENTANITANASDTGDGGTVIVWADNATRYEGEIESKGGPNGGDGGFAEVSGKRYLDFRGYADLSGYNLGTLLLDPDHIDIVPGVANPPEFDGDFIEFLEVDSGLTSTIGADTISGRLTANANVILQANNTIDVDADIISTGDGNLTLETGNGGTITVNNAINVNTGDLTLIADEIDINAALAGTGTIVLTAADEVNQQIEIGSTDAADLNLTAAELSNLSDGWNLITIGGSDRRASITVNEDVSFSDHVELRNSITNIVDQQIDINADITTTDNSDLGLYGRGNAASVHFFDGVNIPAGVEVNVARDLIIDTGRYDIELDGTITTGRDFNVTFGGNSFFRTDMSVGRDFLLDYSTTNGGHALTMNNANIDIARNITMDLQGTRPLRLRGTTLLEADGDITITSPEIEIEPTVQIRSGSGTSNLTFLETGEDDGMEIGDAVSGFTWQMEDAELATIGNNFNSVTFGSASMTGDVDINSWDISSSTYDVEVYGNDIDIGGLDMGSGSFLAQAMDNGGDVADITISADITRGVDGVATLNLRADQNILNSNNADIIASDANSDGDGDPTTDADSLNIILNSDRDGDQAGLIGIGNSTFTTLGGNITMGGGTNPLTTAAYGIAANFVGVNLVNSTFTTGAGNFTANGHARNTIGGFGKKGTALNSARIVTTSGHINISGTGGPGDGSGGTGEHGIVMGNGGGVTPALITDSGNITLTGISQGTGDQAYGIAIGGLDIESNSGNIHITGTSNLSATGTDNQGVFFNTGVGIQTSAGNISVTGTGGNTDEGIFFSAEATEKVQTATGNITLTSLAGDILLDQAIEKTGAGTSELIIRSNDSIIANANADITSLAGPLNVTLNADRDADQNGAIARIASDITTLGGNIILGGGTNPETTFAYGTGPYNHGIEIKNNSILNAGGGNIVLRGHGKTSGGAVKSGIALLLDGGFAPTLTTSGSGLIDLQGQGGGNGGSNLHYGIQTVASTIQAENGNIVFHGTGGNGTDNNYGIRSLNTDVLHTGSGSLIVTAIAGQNTTLDLDDGNGGNSQWGSATTNNITINANSVDLTRFDGIQAANNITIAPRTASSIGLGGAAGDLELSDVALALFDAGNELIIGNSSVASVTIDSWDLTGTNYDVSVLGSNFDINGLTIGAGDMTLNAVQDIVVNTAIGNSGAGGDAYLVAGDNFTNNAGASGIDAGTGRYLVYASAPSNVIKDGLSAGNLYNRPYATNLPNSIESSFGDRFVYGFQPTLTFTPDDITLSTFQPGFNSFTYMISGLETGDSVASVFSGLPTLSTSQQSPGVFSINGSLGSLASLIGYDFAFVPGTLTMLSPSQQLSSTVEFQMQTPNLWQGINTGYRLVFANEGGIGNMSLENAETNTSPQRLRVQIRPNGQRINNGTSSEPQADVRLVEANLMEIDQPLIDFYDLCSYNIQYCR